MTYRMMLTAAALSAALVCPSAAQAPQGVKVGALTCRLAPTIGLIIGSQQRMSCVFQPDGGYPPERYAGVLGKIGLDIGITAGGVMAWGVYAPSSGPLHGALAGTYVGASGSIGVGVGVGANVLFGGSNNTISLQPLSLQGSVSLNVALGVASLTLRWVQ